MTPRARHTSAGSWVDQRNYADRATSQAAAEEALRHELGLEYGDTVQIITDDRTRDTTGDTKRKEFSHV